jgi:predicted double-glycine peptidase
MRKFKYLSFICLLALLFACATTPPTGDDVIIAGVPFFEQDEYQCGPSALATVIDYWYAKDRRGEFLSPEEIASHIYSPGARGVLGIDLELYAKRLGFQADQHSATPSRLREEVRKGVPAIILVDYGFASYQRNHFMVVKGYTREGIIVNSGRNEGEHISYKELTKIWKKTGFWTLSIRPSSS